MYLDWRWVLIVTAPNFYQDPTLLGFVKKIILQPMHPPNPTVAPIGFRSTFITKHRTEQQEQKPQKTSKMKTSSKTEGNLEKIKMN